MFTTLQTSYLLFFTVGWDCGTKSAGYANHYTGTCEGRGGAGWQAASRACVPCQFCNSALRRPTPCVHPPHPPAAACFGGVPEVPLFALSVAMTLLFTVLSMLFALIETGATEPLSRNYLSLSSESPDVWPGGA